MYGAKNSNISIGYTSVLPGFPSFVQNSSVTSSHYSRSGVNGIYKHSSGGLKVIKYTKMMKVRRKIRYRSLRKIEITRTIRSRPIRVLKERLVRGVKVLKPTTIGYTKPRVRKFYKWVPCWKYREVIILKPKRMRMTIVIPNLQEPDFEPHNLTFRRYFRKIADPVVVPITNIADPTLSGFTEIHGAQSGVHTGIGFWGTTCDFIQTFDNGRMDRLWTQAQYQLVDRSRAGIADLSVAAIESPKLAQSVWRMFTAACTSLISTKREFLRRAANGLASSKNLSGAALEWIYGLSPAIDDFNNIIREMNEKARTWRKYKGSATESWETETFVPAGLSKMIIKRKFTVTVKLQIMVTGTYQCPLIENHSVPPGDAALWELTPWSFAIDWLIPIGNWLAADQLLSGVTVKSIHRTILYKETYEMTTIHGGLSGNYRVGEATTVCSGELFQMSRTVGGGLPPLPFPRLKNPFSSTHIRNTIFLLISKLR